MDKDIIIDGINVAECEFLRRCVIPDNEGCKIDDSLCCDVGNCYYKQLKRLEFELKVTRADYEASEQENERLKETEKEISDFISDISTCGFRYDYRSPDNLDELQQCIEDLCNKFDNYEHTLQEIKKIAEEIADTGNWLNCGYNASRAKKILDLITKAEEE